ncbi:MAG: hypothetical protein Q4G58_01165 [bacterium]|nr:hypothetical protein [bacterium]
MKSKKMPVFLWSEAILCGLLSIALYFLAEVKETYQLLYAPFELLGKGLRAMSLSSSVGNVGAVLLYVLICLLPLLLYIPNIIKKRKIQSIHWMLVLLSAYLFFSLYYFINPEFIPELFHQGFGETGIQQIGKYTLSLLFYLLLASYIMIKCLKNMEQGQQESGLVRHLQNLLTILTYGYTAFLTVVESMNLIEIVTRKVAQGKEMTKGYYFIIECLNMLPSVFLILLLVKAVALLAQLRKEQYSEDTVETAKALSWAGKITVYITLISCISGNLLQLVLASNLSNVKFTMTVPIFPLVIAYVSMLLANYFKTSNELYEDKQMII